MRFQKEGYTKGTPSKLSLNAFAVARKPAFELRSQEWSWESAHEDGVWELGHPPPFAMSSSSPQHDVVVHLLSWD